MEQAGAPVTQSEKPEPVSDLAIVPEQTEILPTVAAPDGSKLPSQLTTESENAANFTLPDDVAVGTDDAHAEGFALNSDRQFVSRQPSDVSEKGTGQLQSHRGVRTNIRELGGPITTSMQRLQAAVVRADTPVGESRERQEWLDSLQSSIRDTLLGGDDKARNDKGTAEVPDLAVAGETDKKRTFSDFINEREEIESGLTHAAKSALVREGVAAGAVATPVAATPKAAVPLMDRPFGHAEWDQDLGDRVLWMAGRSMQAADLRLNPPSLGPVEVRISMNQDQTSIAFSSQHAVVREAIEAAIPKLREMFGSQQLNLIDVNVSQHSFSEQQRQYHGGGGGFGHHENAPDLAVSSEVEDMFEANVDPENVSVGNRLLNLYV